MILGVFRRTVCIVHVAALSVTRTSCIARYVNDAPEKYSKYVMKKMMFNGIPKLALVA